VEALKTDDRHAEAIAEAATRPTTRLVPLNGEDQLDLRLSHRARERLVLARDSLINQLRTLLLERGIPFPMGRTILLRRLNEMGLDELAVSFRPRQLLGDLRRKSEALDTESGLARRTSQIALGREFPPRLAHHPASRGAHQGFH
jgi:transposase